MEPAFPPLTAFMPHRPPMLLLDAMRAHSEDECTCVKAFRAGDPLVDASGVSALAVIELFAQTAAAHFGYAGLVKGGAMASGALLGTRRIDLSVERLPLDREIVIVVKRVMAIPPMAQFDCTASLDGEVIARGSINVAMGGPPPQEG
jgi:predicted hotdog family 3-hydroxylacyl-ACP dehydratase